MTATPPAPQSAPTASTARVSRASSDICTGSLVKPKGNPRNATFRVLSLTRNGWARCCVYAYHDGERPTAYHDGFKFRITHLEAVK